MSVELVWEIVGDYIGYHVDTHILRKSTGWSESKFGFGTMIDWKKFPNNSNYCGRNFLIVLQPFLTVNYDLGHPVEYDCLPK